MEWTSWTMRTYAYALYELEQQAHALDADACTRRWTEWECRRGNTAVKCGKFIYYYLLQPRVMSYTGLVKTFMTDECFFFCKQKSETTTGCFICLNSSVVYVTDEVALEESGYVGHASGYKIFCCCFFWLDEHFLTTKYNTRWACEWQ